jgi:protein-disulfide isomerase
MILKDLKDHKEQIISREWSFEAFKDFFSRKGKDVKNNKRNYKQEVQNNKETHINSKITNTPIIISSPEKQTEDEWDDDW